MYSHLINQSSLDQHDYMLYGSSTTSVWKGAGADPDIWVTDANEGVWGRSPQEIFGWPRPSDSRKT